MKNKAPDIQQVNQAVWKHLSPEHVAIERWRAEELPQRHGLTSELDERGAMGARKRSHDGWGTRSITTVVPGWRTSLGGGRMRSFGNSKPYESRVASGAFTPMAGGTTSGRLPQSSLTLGRSLRRPSRGNISSGGHASSVSSVAPCASRKRSRCTLWSLASSAIAMNLGSLSNTGSTPVKHLRPPLPIN